MIALALATSIGGVVALLIDGYASESRNVARLAQHFGWPRSEAAEVHAMARRVGFGAAYRARRTQPRSLPI